MAELKRFVIVVPYSQTVRETAQIAIEGTSAEQAKCEAMAVVRRHLPQGTLLHDAEVVHTTLLEIVGD